MSNYSSTVESILNGFHVKLDKLPINDLIDIVFGVLERNQYELKYLPGFDLLGKKLSNTTVTHIRFTPPDVNKFPPGISASTRVARMQTVDSRYETNKTMTVELLLTEGGTLLLWKSIIKKVRRKNGSEFREVATKSDFVVLDTKALRDPVVSSSLEPLGISWALYNTLVVLDDMLRQAVVNRRRHLESVEELYQYTQRVKSALRNF